MSKAAAEGVELPEEVAFFIAKRIRSNVRELEGALRRVVANARFTRRPIDLEFAKEALRDLLALQDRLVSIENIQKTVAEYFKIRVGGSVVQAAQPIDCAAAADRDGAGEGTDAITACRKSGMPSAAGTTRRCCTAAGASRRCGRRTSESTRIISTC